MRSLLVVLATLFVASQAEAQVYVPVAPVYVPYVQPVVQPVYVQPAPIYVPQVQYVPYQYRGTVLHKKHTPIRTWLFGTRVYSPTHLYSPVVNPTKNEK